MTSFLLILASHPGLLVCETLESHCQERLLVRHVTLVPRTRTNGNKQRLSSKTRFPGKQDKQNASLETAKSYIV